MKVSVKRTGGYAGLNEEVVAVDTAQIDPVAAQGIEQIVQSFGFFNLPATVGGGGIGADLIRYEITVSDGGRQHIVAFEDDGSLETAPLRGLVDSLSQAA